jgi:hypothetical protein
MDYYTVEFRIYGANLDIDKVSKNLGLNPSTIQIQGKRRDRNSTFSESMWGYGKVDGSGLKQSSSLEDGIADILLDLTPLKTQLRNDFKNAVYLFWCGHFHDTFGAGPSLSSQLMRSVSRLGASINISTYFDDGIGPLSLARMSKEQRKT